MPPATPKMDNACPAKVLSPPAAFAEPEARPFSDADRPVMFFCRLLAALPALAPAGANLDNPSTARRVLLLTLGSPDKDEINSLTPADNAGSPAAALDILEPDPAIPPRAATRDAVPAWTAGAWDIAETKRPISADNTGRYCCTVDRLPADADSCARELKILAVPAATLSAPANDDVKPWNAVPRLLNEDRSAPETDCNPTPNPDRSSPCNLRTILTVLLILSGSIPDNLLIESARLPNPCPRLFRPLKSPAICSLDVSNPLICSSAFAISSILFVTDFSPVTD